MPLETAPTGRSKCRGCGRAIEKGELRFGELVPNPFGSGEATLWFHPACAAYKRPDAVIAAAPDDAELVRIATASAAHRRLARVDGAERAPSGQATCRECKERIEKGAWRIRLAIYDEARFNPAGSIHLACRKPYFEDHDVLAPMLRFSAKLSDEERAELEQEYRAGS
jgi:hypothetical protein